MAQVGFEVGGLYLNRLGFYKVLEINGDKMNVRYEADGHTTTLSMEIQETIVANIRREEREERTDSYIARDRATFFFYVGVCEEAYRSGHDLSLYRKIISRHRNSGGLGSLLDDDSFHKRACPIDL